MRNVRLVSLFASALIGWTSLSGKPWTVEEAVATALRQSPDALTVRHRIAAAESMIRQADAAWQPQVMLSGGYTQTNDPLAGLMFSLNQRNFGFDRDFNRPGWVDDLHLGGTVAYSLYRGGTPTARREAARAVSRASEQDLRVVQLRLSAEVMKVMLNLRKARESVTALETGVKVQETTLAHARLRSEAGQLLKAELLSLEVQTAQVRARLTSAQHAAALAARTFLYLLGSEPSPESIDLVDNDPGIAGLSIPETADFSLRPELLAFQDRLRAAESMVEAARGGRRPSVDAFVGANYHHGWDQNRHAHSYQGGVRVDFKVFDGGLASAQIRQASAERDELKEMLRMATLRIGLEVEQARLAHADARERLAVTEVSVAQAEESASLSRLRFEKGGLLATELIGSESRLIDMRLARTVALADERMAVIDLRRALGLPLLPQP